MIPLLGLLAGGPDPDLVAAAVACGQPPEATRGAARVAGIRFYYPDDDVMVGTLELDEQLLPPQAYEAVLLTGPGERVTLPPRGSAWESRLAHVIAVADTADELRGALEDAAKAIRLEPAQAPA